MAGERAQQLRKAARDATVEAMRAIEENGELKHLYGQRLDLDDDPDWFLHRMLKRDGLSLPLLERGKDIDALTNQAEAIAERLRRRRDWLTRPETRLTLTVADDFNGYRERLLAEYRERLVALNKAILDYNLTAPTQLQRHGVIVDQRISRLTDNVPPLQATAPEPAPAHTAPSSWGSRLRRRLLPG